MPWLYSAVHRRTKLNIYQTVSMILSAPTYRFASCSRFKQQVTIQQNFVIDSITTARGRSVTWKAIFLPVLSYAAGAMITQWEKKAVLFVTRPYIVDEQKLNGTCIFTYIFALASRRTRVKDAVIYFPKMKSIRQIFIYDHRAAIDNYTCEV